jgi:methyl-galactoside transport system permease protein
MNPVFISFRSIVNLVSQTSTRIPIAVGVAGIIILTGTDLSAGRAVGLTAIIAASLLQVADYPYKIFPGLAPLSPILVVLIVMIVGGLVGALNGFFTAKFKLHPFIVTLATSLIVYALSLSYIKLGTNNGMPIAELDNTFKTSIVGGFTLFGILIKWQILYSILILVIIWIIWNKTVFGKNMYAVGCNPEAANVAGVSVFKTTLFVFILAGVLYGISGIYAAADAGSAAATTGLNFELDAIAACVIGGVSFSGGVGKISGVILGVFLLQLISTAFVFLGVDAQLQYAIKGAVILLAVSLDMRKYIVKK